MWLYHLFQTGSKEDLPHTFDDSKDESVASSKSGYLNYPDGSSYERQTIHNGSNQKMEIMQDQKTYSGNKFKVKGTFIPRRNGCRRPVYILLNYTAQVDFPLLYDGLEKQVF